MRCHRELSQFRLHNNFTKLDGQFSSTKGIGRAPSLVVLDQFKEVCDKNLIGSETVEGAKNLVTQKVNQLINDARNASNNPRLIPHQTQIDELTAACFEVYQEVIFNRDDQQAEQPAPSSSGSHSSDEIPDLVEASDLEEERIIDEEAEEKDERVMNDDAVYSEDEWVYGNGDLSSDTNIASSEIHNADPDVKGVPFDVNYWAWDEDSDTYQEVKNNWATMNEAKKIKLIEELNQASDWVQQHLSDNEGNFEESIHTKTSPRDKLIYFFKLVDNLSQKELEKKHESLIKIRQHISTYYFEANSA